MMLIKYGKTAVVIVFCVGLCAWAKLVSAEGKSLCQTGKILVVPNCDKGGVVSEFVTTRNTPAEAKTTATVCWDDAGLTVLFECEDKEIVAKKRPRDDEEMWMDDCVEVFLDVGHTHDTKGPWVHVLVSASGGIFDQRAGESGYNAKDLRTKVEKTAGGWRAEMTIPWDDVGVRPAVGEVWGFNLNREEHPIPEYICWSPTWGEFKSIQQWGHILFAGPDADAAKALVEPAEKRLAEKHARVTKRLQSKSEYISRVTRGEGFMPWQKKEGVSAAEKEYRLAIEKRKDELLAHRMPVKRPVMLTDEEVANARRNIERTDWAKEWYAGIKELADYIVSQPDDYIEKMISEQSPIIGRFICPHCAGRLSQDGVGEYEWDYRNPDIIRCKACGRIYPDPKYPETGKLVCPRRGQTFTYYRRKQEREHPEDHSGKYAWNFCGLPVHTSFSNIIRAKKTGFVVGAPRNLALMYRFTGDPRYAEKAVKILMRVAHCYRSWLWHDQFHAIADCDPLYAAGHDLHGLKLEWKRHLGGSVFEKNTFGNVGMLDDYWGAGRLRPGVGGIHALKGYSLAYDLTYDAKDVNGTPLWTPEKRRVVERDVFLEFVMDGMPWLTREGSKKYSNMAAGVYNAIASAGKCLGIAEYVDLALKGYEGMRDFAFIYDGFSHETPAYTHMYLSGMLPIPEKLEGFRWPRGYPGRYGVVDLYKTDSLLPLMLRAVGDQLQPNGQFLPLSDTQVGGGPSTSTIDIGLRRLPEFFEGKRPALSRGQQPSEYALYHLKPKDMEFDTGLHLPEILFPAWKTAILRHGSGPDSTVLAFAFNPAGVHRHYDSLNVYYSDCGNAVLGDLGYMGSVPQNWWIHRTGSHNLVMVDDGEQLGAFDIYWIPGPHRRDPSLRFMVTSPRVSVVEASVKAYEQCSEYRRLIALVKGPVPRSHLGEVGPGAETFAFDIFRVKGGEKHEYRLFSELASSDAKNGAIEFTCVNMPPEKPLPDYGASMNIKDIEGLRDTRTAANPPASWQATWKEHGRAYRFWMLSQVDRIEASHGPGQETYEQMGRRVRVVGAVKMGKNLSSTFVAVHEPSGVDGTMPIAKAERLKVPEVAGPDAVAVRIYSKWGTYLVFSEFANEAEIAGVRFQGTFGIVCTTPEGKPDEVEQSTLQGRRWLLSCGAGTLKSDDFGFENAPAAWSGKVVKHMKETLTADTKRPLTWPKLPAGVKAYVCTGGGNEYTGFPVRKVGRKRITVERFPLQPAERFKLPAVQYIEE